jgi:septum formation protein
MGKYAARVILASASPRRIELMKEWGLKPRIIPSHIDEKTRYRRPHEHVKDLALQKARSVAERVAAGIVVGADTIVVLKGTIIGKPRDERDAARILGSLSGSRHRVYTGIAAIDAASGATRVTYAVSTVKMRRLAPGEIRRLSGKHLDKAGAYAVQEKEDSFVEKIEGDYFNVVGLPRQKLRQLLRPFGVIF